MSQGPGIIDFRLRPPLYGLLNLGIWEVESISRFARVQGIAPATSALDRSMDRLLAEMEKSGIVAGVIDGRQVGSWPGQVSNEDLVKIITEYPQMFFALAGANPYLGKRSLDESEHYIRDHGFSGIALDAGLYTPPLLADDEMLWPFYELCIKYDCPAVLPIGPFDGPDVSYASAVPVDKIAGRYPELKMVVSHGCWPYVAELCAVACRRPNVYLMPDMYFLGLPGEQSYTAAINTFAADQFLFATAYPSRPLQLTVEQYRALPISAIALAKVFYETAARLLKLEPV